MATQRTINHGNNHIDTERLFTDADGNQVWAVIQCNQESDMYNGYVESEKDTQARAKRIKDARTYSLQAQAEQVKLRDAIVADCAEQVTHFTSSIASAYIVDDAHPVDEAQAIERKIDAQLWPHPNYDELLNGAKFTDEHRADLHKWWNKKYA